MARKKLDFVYILRIFLSLGTILVYKRAKGASGYNRVTGPRLIVSVLMVSFLFFVLWPNCIGNVCYSMLWDGSYSPGSLWGFYLIAFIFLPSFLYSLMGLVGYLMGYQTNEYYDWVEKSNPPDLKRRRHLLVESSVILIVTSFLIGLCIWNIILMNRVGIFLFR